MFELQLLAPEACVEMASDALINELEAVSVSFEDADANTSAESALFGEPGLPAPKEAWRRSLMKALFENEAAAMSAATVLLAQDWAKDLQLRALSKVADQDWVRLTQLQFAPVPVTADFWVVPSWHEAPPEARRVIQLDPGLAFGTGTHPTTRMCLKWTAQHAPQQPAEWARVLDYGCGSGILAIGAALHGAQDITAVDIDPAAVESAAANARRNQVRVQTGLPDVAAGVYPLVFANILAAPLKLLAPLLSSYVEPGGTLVLAGILDRQADELIAAYASWLPLEVSDSDDGWILMTAKRPC